MIHIYDIEQDEYLNQKYRNPKAYERFKASPTNYGSKKKCNYGERKKLCDAGCKFWDSCKHGRYKTEWKGVRKDARGNAES